MDDHLSLATGEGRASFQGQHSCPQFLPAPIQHHTNTKTWCVVGGHWALHSLSSLKTCWR